MVDDKVVKGLIIDKKWLDMILAGQKTWELRSRHVRYRGPVALIAKGTGRVFGVTSFIDSLGPLGEKELSANQIKHRVPESMWQPVEKFDWRFAWALGATRVLKEPVPYYHVPGTQSWVNLEPGVAKSIEDQLEQAIIVNSSNRPSDSLLISRIDVEAQASKKAAKKRGKKMKSNVDKSAYRQVLRINTDGGLKNKYLLVTEIIDWFPNDVVGGSNRASAAPKTLRLHWGGDAPLDTDIDGTKNFIRDRTWFPLFVKLHNLQVGDSVQLSRVNNYEYTASPIKSAHPVTKV